MLISMVFNAIKKSHFRPKISYLDINFLFFEAQNIYFVPNCTGQPDHSIVWTQEMLRSSIWVHFMTVLIFKNGILEFTSGFDLLTLMAFYKINT